MVDEDQAGVTLGRAIWRKTQPFLEAAGLGVILGTIDVLNTGTTGPMMLGYLGVGVLAGVRHAGRAWTCWLPLGASMYLVHCLAIRLGQVSPYVEPTTVAARQCLIYLWPAGIGLLAGVGIRVAVGAAGWFRRQSGPPVRLVPRTTLGTMGAVAWVAICWAVLNWAGGEAITEYAPGYSEARFRQVRVGESEAEVTAALGPPLRVWDRGDPSIPGEYKAWAYSYGVSDTSSYWRRWVLFRNGKVEGTVADFWYD